MRATTILLLLAACGSDPAKPDAPIVSVDAAPANPQAIVVAGDYTAGHPGVLSKLDLVTMTMSMNAGPAMAVGDDPVIRKFGDELFIVNRADGNNITILDASTLALKEQLATGAGSNPQDVAVMGDKLFVPVYGGTGIVVLTRGSATIDAVALAAGDNPDGHPDCASIMLVGSQLYIACDLLDSSFTPVGMGKVYVIDATSHTLVKTVTLQHVDPFGLFAQSPASSAFGGDLVIQVDPFSPTGCVERISTGTAATSKGCVVNNAQLGDGFASRIDFQTQADSSVVMWMAVAKSDFVNANLQGFDLASNTLWATPVTPTTEVVGDVAACPGNRVVITDKHKTAANGLRVYTNGTETTTAPLAVGLDPESAQGLICY